MKLKKNQLKKSPNSMDQICDSGYETEIILSIANQNKL